MSLKPYRHSHTGTVGTPPSFWAHSPFCPITTPPSRYESQQFHDIVHCCRQHGFLPVYNAAALASRPRWVSTTPFEEWALQSRAVFLNKAFVLVLYLTTIQILLLLCIVVLLSYRMKGSTNPYENIRVYVRVYIKNSYINLHLSEPESSRWSGHFVVAEETWVRIPVPASKKIRVGLITYIFGSQGAMNWGRIVGVCSLWT